MGRTQSLLVVLTLTLAVTASSAVQPVVPLTEMAPLDACLYICEMCLPDDKDKENKDLMLCVNSVCRHILLDGTCGNSLRLSVGMLWLGNKCRNIQSVFHFMDRYQTTN